MLKNLLATKPVAALIDDANDGAADGPTLKRTLTAGQLVMLGIGAVIGAGIFVLTGTAAANHAGPALMLSFVFAGVACGLAGMCYAEFASMMPVSGSAYSYSYATLGEFAAWFIGWCLVMEYLFAASTVAVGWSGYFNELLDLASGWTGIRIAMPDGLGEAPFTFIEGGRLATTGAIFNLPAVALVIAISWLCYLGVTQSAFVNSIIVVIKVAVILMVIAFTFSYINPDHWVPFIPESEGPGRFGWSGVMRGATVVCFAYLGFDAVSTSAGEARNPQRDMPIGILGSLLICTVLYIAMVAVLTGIADFRTLDTPEPVATALAGYPSLDWLRTLVVFGALTGLSSVVLVMLMGQPRIFYSMAKDGMIPKVFARVHPKHRTPYVGTIVVGIAAVGLAGLFPVKVLGELVAMGTLLAFTLVCVGVLVLRYTQPDLPRPFRVPFVHLTCPLGAFACLYLLWQPLSEHWRLLLGWIVIGMLIYAFYGYHHSRLRKPAQTTAARD